MLAALLLGLMMFLARQHALPRVSVTLCVSHGRLVAGAVLIVVRGRLERARAERLLA